MTLWCEYFTQPLAPPNGKGDKRGVYELNLPRAWFVKAVPFLEAMTVTLGLVGPVAASATKLVLNEGV